MARFSRTPRTSRARIGRPGRALTASASPADNPRTGLQRLDQGWQRTAMLYYRSIGECWYPAQFYTRAMKRIRYFPAILGENDDPTEVTSGPLLEIFRQIQDPGGGINQIATTYGQLQFCIGDGYLVASMDGDTEVWEYLSPMELRLQPRSGPTRPQDYRRIRAPGITPEELTEAPDDDFEPLTGNKVRVWRLWRRHPEFSSWSDSPIRPILEVYELLSRLTLGTGARASSRAAQQGALFVPEELSFGPVDKTQDEDLTNDPLMKDLLDSYVRAIQNPGSAEAMMPFLIRGPGMTQTAGGNTPTKDLIGIIPLNVSDTYPEGEFWDKVIDRIAGSLDMPREMVAPSGLGSTNHWSGWILEDSAFRLHVAPMVIDFCSDITSAYFRPAAISAGVPNAERVVVWFDPSEAVNHPDQIGTTFKAHDRLLISDAAAREGSGFAESDAPDAEEYARRVEIMLKTIPPEVAAEAGGETTPAQGGTGSDANKQPPSQPSTERAPTSPPAQRGPVSASAQLTALILGAAELQIDHARERAGNQLVRRSQRYETCQQKIKDVPRAQVAATMGEEMVRTVLEGHGSELDLVAGSFVPLVARLRKWGLDGTWPEQLAKMVEQHALRTLYETEVPPMPPGFTASCERAVA